MKIWIKLLGLQSKENNSSISKHCWLWLEASWHFSWFLYYGQCTQQFHNRILYSWQHNLSKAFVLFYHNNQSYDFVILLYPQLTIPVTPATPANWILASHFSKFSFGLSQTNLALELHKLLVCELHCFLWSHSFF